MPNITYDIKIQVRFEKDGLNDALYFTEQEWANNPDVEKLKQERYDNWQFALKNPPVPVEPTKEELEVWKADLQKQIDEVQSKIDKK